MESFRAKKSLGQNFLKSKKAITDIIEAGAISPEDIILEVGPGKGVLTEKLVEKAKKVIAVEKDERLLDVVKTTFKEQISSKKLELVYTDILEFKSEEYGLKQCNYKLIANIPYYITGALIRLFLSGNCQPSRMVLLLQKEVAKRIVAHDNKESILSISVKAYGTPHYRGTVKAKYFSPEPNVDSGILLIENISKKIFTENNIREEDFFELIKLGFAHKRKMLIGNLKEKYSHELLQKAFQASGLDGKIRAEDMNLGQWKKLFLLLSIKEQVVK